MRALEQIWILFIGSKLFKEPAREFNGVQSRELEKVLGGRSNEKNVRMVFLTFSEILFENFITLENS